MISDSIRPQRFDLAASCDRLKRTTNPIENTTHRQAIPLLLYGASAPRSARSYLDAAARRLRLRLSISISISISFSTTRSIHDPQMPSTTTATTAAAAVAAAAIPLEHGRVRRSAQPAPIIAIPRCLLQQGPVGRPAPHRGQAGALPIVSRRPGEGEPVLLICSWYDPWPRRG